MNRQRLSGFSLMEMMVVLLIVSIVAAASAPMVNRKMVADAVGGCKWGEGNNIIFYNGNRENRNVSLMFNVYENTQVVNGIVSTLDEYGVKATFFVGGCWADDNGETLERIVKSGHELANHGYFHKDHKNLDYQINKQEML